MNTLTFKITRAGKPFALHLQPATHEDRMIGQALTGARPQTDGTITYALNPTMVPIIEQAFGSGLIMATSVREWQEAYERHVMTRRALIQRRDAEVPSDVQHMLRPYQRIGVRWLADGRRAMLADKMGLGKTPTALFAAQEVGAQRILIITYAIVKVQWQHEVMRWLGREAVVADGTIAERQAIIASNPDILIINYDMLVGCYDAPAVPAKYNRKTETWRLAQPERPASYLPLLKQKWDVLILDEAHRVQSHDKDVKQAKAAEAIARVCPYVFELTGTPVWNMPDSIWHLLHMLDETRFPSYWDFVSRYCLTQETIYGLKVVGIRRDTKQEFQELLAEYILQRTKEQVLPQLPPKMRDTRYYQLAPAQMGYYQTIKKELVIPQLAGDEYLANAASALAPLRRLCNAPALLGYDDIQSPKDALLLDIVENVLSERQKIVILCWHRDYAAYLGKLLRKKHYSVLSATDMNATKRVAVIDLFKQDPTQVLIGTIGGMGTGISLDNIVKDVIFAELDWTPLQNEQAEDRFHRFTTREPVTIYRLIAQNTIEQHILEVAENKEAIITELMALQAVLQKLRNER